jgi:hypothetical protein
VTYPCQDPESEVYKKDPERVWCAGRWRTLEQAEHRRKQDRDRHSERYWSDPEFREERRRRRTEDYWAMSGMEYSLMLLRSRRFKALKRRAAR